MVHLSGQSFSPTKKFKAFFEVMKTNKRSVEKGLFILLVHLLKMLLDIQKSNIKLALTDNEKLIEMFEKVELGVVAKTVYKPNRTFFE